jgi:sugar lactone lactonase YvrE
MAFDAQGRLFVADRGNNRLQLFDQDGKFLEQWTQFGKASGVYIVGDRIYVADAGPAAGAGGPAPGWKKGVRIGSVKEKKVLDFIEDIDPGNPNWSTDPKGNGPEGCAADTAGNVYASYVTQRTLVKFARR